MAKTKTNDVLVISLYVSKHSGDRIEQGSFATVHAANEHLESNASLVIGDKAMSMSEVQAMVKEIVDGASAGEELTIETIAAKYGVKI